MLSRFYRSIFSIDEIESHATLQRVYWAVLAGFFISFIFWVSDRTISVEAVGSGQNVCLPYFQNCDGWYFLREAGWLTPAFFYALITSSLVVSAIGALSNRWAIAHAFLLPATIWKFLYLFVLANGAGSDYEYFHLPVLLIFLFSPNKLFFSRLIFIIVYTLSATMKFRDAWMTGSYFFSLESGLPLIPNALIPWVTHGVALFEIVTPWWLLSRNPRLRTFAFYSWLVFHVYSVQLVDFRYPLHCLTMMLALFFASTEAPAVHRDRRNFIAYLVIAALYVVTMTGELVSGDPEYNLKSMKLGVRMFDANHQCVSNLQITGHDGNVRNLYEANRSSVKRCSPYPIWFRSRALCADAQTAKVSWQFKSSVNGDAFYELVNVGNICESSYSIFSNNSWFREPSDVALIAGYPRKNRLLDEINPPPEAMVFPTPQIETPKVVSWLRTYLREFKIGYWIAWALVSLLMLWRIFRYETSR